KANFGQLSPENSM
nr:1,4-beta-D-xylan xylanohydrolase, endo 1,4-beta-xylanase {peptide 5} {EC 3.2.1.8} [Penicillium chrysogenum, Q 176, Peptide Partial, 13 aa] [Penicillium chrysogenum]